MHTEQIGDCTLYLGDCLEILPTLGKVDAVVTDPPYGINHPCDFADRKRGNLAGCNNYPKIKGDEKPFDPSPLLSLMVPTVLWGGNYFSDMLPASDGWLIWDKKRPDNLDQSTCEMAWTNCIKGVRRFSHLWNGMMRESEQGENYHPMQKPAALFVWTLSLRWLNKIKIVLDPYMGSSPCGVACVRLGLNYIGIESEEYYFDIACRRIENEYKQPKLFTEPEPEYRQNGLEL